MVANFSKMNDNKFNDDLILNMRKNDEMADHIDAACRAIAQMAPEYIKYKGYHYQSIRSKMIDLNQSDDEGDIGKNEIRINIAERFISRITNGQNATVTFDAYPSLVFGAKVFEVSPVLDTSTRTMGVKLRLNPPDSRVKVGMYGRVRLVTDSVKNAIVLPSSALVTRDGKDYVFVITSPKSGKNAAVVGLKPVTKGISVDNNVEITKGLEIGEEVVIKGQTLLNDGSKVNVVSSK